MLSYTSPRHPGSPASPVDAPTRPSRHPRRTTALLTLIKDADNTIFSVGHKLANEFHQIFTPHTRTLDGGISLPKDGIFISRPSTPSPNSDLDGPFSSSPSSYTSSPKHSHSYSLSTSTCVSVPSPLASPSRKTRNLSYTHPYWPSSSSESLKGDVDSATALEGMLHETIGDPYLIKLVEPLDEAEERERLRSASARAAFRLPPVLESRGIDAARLARSKPKDETFVIRTVSKRKKMSTSVARAASFPTLSRENAPATLPPSPCTGQEGAGGTKAPLGDMINMEEEMITDFRWRRQVSQTRKPKRPLRISQSLSPIVHNLSSRIADIPITPPPLTATSLLAPGFAIPETLCHRAPESFLSLERTPSSTTLLNPLPLSPPGPKN